MMIFPAFVFSEPSGVLLVVHSYKIFRELMSPIPSNLPVTSRKLMPPFVQVQWQVFDGGVRQFGAAEAELRQTLPSNRN